MTGDGAALQIFANYCAAAAEAMAYTLMRTAHSTFVKETEDFSCGLLTPEGLTFASPKTLGATWYVGLDYGSAIRQFDDYREGDICITNDVYSGFVATHTPDIHIWKPVFHAGRIVCFVAGHIHNTDMRGAVPASLSRTLTEIHQEGIRIPPSKLMHEGRIDEKLLNLLRLNVRAPDQNMGDLHAQIASVNTGERKLHDMIARLGVDQLSRGMYALLDYAEAQARAIVRDIPDGDYFFDEYADEDSAGGYPLRIALTVQVRGDELVLDYTGTDPQVHSSLNIPTGGRERHVLATVGLVYVLYTLDPRLVLNAGILRMCRCVLPEGTMLNPQSPAAVGMRSLTCLTLMQVTFGAFSLALPDRLAASPAGGLAIINVNTTTRDNRSVLASIGPVGGGAGGSATIDGSEGSGANTCFLRNTPVEIIESEVPIRMRQYGLVPDSGGPGRFRGGCGTLMEFQVFAPHTVVTARNRDRSRFAAWGVCGGEAGNSSRFTRNPGFKTEQELGNADVVPLEPGDILRVQGSGGGGYGPAWDRNLDLVLHDVRAGFISTQSARERYGVVIRDGEADLAATESLRARMRQRPNGHHFDPGPGRAAYEAIMTPERYAALTRILAEIPVSWRFYLKHRILDTIFDAPGRLPDGGRAIEQAYQVLRQRFPELPDTTNATSGLSASDPTPP
ncbi:MAG TPA: hydantoinase B/oxoprolinase family protein [Acetobacteraceae bacterium]|nr:hydantoinase B/oxoprolinase family protein [Acetobacteraceae bacterium]